MVQKEKLSANAASIGPGVHLWSKAGLQELGKGLSIA